MDELKKYLQQNREALDTDAPREIVWKQVKQQAVKKKTAVRSMIRYAVAASILALLLLSIKWLTKNNTTTVTPVKIVKQAPVTKDPVTALPGLPEITNTDIIPAKASITKATSSKAQAATMYELVNALGRSYAEVVQLQLKSIRSIPLYADEPGYFDIFKTELRQMDEVELAVRNTIKQKGPDDMLLEQLINVYQQKLDLLKTLRAEINKVNDRVKQYQSPADSSQTFYLDI